MSEESRNEISQHEPTSKTDKIQEADARQMMQVKKSSGASRKNRLAKQDARVKAVIGRPPLPAEIKRKENQDKNKDDKILLSKLEHGSSEWKTVYNRIKKRESRNPLLLLKSKSKQ